MFETLKARRDFLAIARSGHRWVTPHFIVQALPGSSDQTKRFGYTASKKVGNAVLRNRAKRRLRELVRLELAPSARPGWSYVLVARHTDEEAVFSKLVRDGHWAMKRLHQKVDGI